MLRDAYQDQIEEYVMEELNNSDIEEFIMRELRNHQVDIHESYYSNDIIKKSPDDIEDLDPLDFILGKKGKNLKINVK